MRKIMSNKKHLKILIIPLDDRPVSYDLPKNTASFIRGTEIFIPPKSMLGSLTKTADTDAILNWIKDTIDNNQIDVILLSLDTIAYGGLIPSRRIVLGFDEIKSRIDKCTSIFENLAYTPKVYAFSSIMRISNNNINEEEKTYWDKYGEKIFKYSYLTHKMVSDYDHIIENELVELAQTIPFEVVEDYLNTRKRNFEINLYYLELAQKSLFDYLVFSQDDTAQYGFNVEEKDLLNKQIQSYNLQNVQIKTGADEIITALLSRAVVEFYGKEKIKICPVFFNEEAKKIISRYEDIDIETSVKSQIEICGGKAVCENYDLTLVVNAPGKIQDDICLGILEDTLEHNQADLLAGYLAGNANKTMIADIKNANGADNYLIDKLFGLGHIDLYGYSAWNTTGNTLGSLIAMGIVRFLAEKIDLFDREKFDEMMITRFLDDWAYQANVRAIIRQENNPDAVDGEMLPFEQRLASFLNFNKKVSYSFPWNRIFEIEVVLD
ncbi:MAG: DUF4127 family protein [Candidatus Gastranaerophilales bacterium]|nr:DUF4127 family protein [Candidatus Gastranaerophilales bacterium]